MRTAFVQSVLARLLKRRILSADSSVLAVCAKSDERDVLRRIGLSSVVISNLDERVEAEHVEPFEWSRQDAENLTFRDASFDFVLVSAGLHHCASPHRGLLEMYRVARKGVIVFEPADTALARLARRSGFAPDFELAAVVNNDFRAGGVRNSAIPNYVYRWTEREFEKTLTSNDPTGRIRFLYVRDLDLLHARVFKAKNRWKAALARLARPLAGLLATIFRTQGNSLAMIALKPTRPDDLWPWLEESAEGLRFRRDYARSEHSFKR